jgi:hypothetical protein
VFGPCSDLLVPQQLSRSVQIFGAEGIVGEAVTGRRRVLDVRGIPQPAIITGELLGLHQHLVFVGSVMETALKLGSTSAEGEVPSELGLKKPFLSDLGAAGGPRCHSSASRQRRLEQHLKPLR